MVVVQVQNLTASSSEFILPWPSDVSIHIGADSKSALAFYWPWEKGWVIKGSGKLLYEVEPNKAVEILYVIPGFSGEATIELPNIGTLKVNLPTKP